MFKDLFNSLFMESQKLTYSREIAKHLAQVLLAMPQDRLTEGNIYNLHPQVLSLVKRLILECGESLTIVSTLRTFKEQERLYAQGRTTAGAIVTNARAGESYHCYGLSLDFRFENDPLFNAPYWRWKKIGELWESYGGIWGGRFDGLNDLGHLEWHPNFLWEDLKPHFT